MELRASDGQRTPRRDLLGAVIGFGRLSQLGPSFFSRFSRARPCGRANAVESSMKPVPTRSRSLVWLSVLPVCAVLVDRDRQRTTEHGRATATWPTRFRLPGTASPKPSRPAPKPEGVTPSVPAGFTVSDYAELQAPRMMVYAPNGDLFVSSPRRQQHHGAARRQQRRRVRGARRLCAGRGPAPARWRSRRRGWSGAHGARRWRCGRAPPPAATASAARCRPR